MGYTPPASIDIGNTAIDRDQHSLPGNTQVDRNNPANLSGKITSIEIYTQTAMTGVDVATFFVVSGTYLSTRDHQNIGNIPLGYSSHSVDIDVIEGDFLGICWDSGNLEVSAPTCVGVYRGGNNLIPCTNISFGTVANRMYSIYGTGDTGEGKLTIGEAFSVVDSFVKNVIKQLAETFSAIDSWIARINLSESFSMVDSVVKNAVKQLSETLNTVDSKVTNAIQRLHEAFTVIDSFKRFFYSLYSKVSKSISTYTKVNKSESNYIKKDKERGEE